MHWRTLVSLALLATAGCGYMRDHPPTMGADVAQTGQEGIALVNQLRRAYVIDDKVLGCQGTRGQFQERDAMFYRDRLDRGKLPGDLKCVVFRPATAAGIASHLDAGFAYSDYLCVIFFDRIAQHSRQRHFARGVVNDVGAAVSAVLGFTSVAPGIVGGAGAGFGLVDSSFRNYDDAFLVSTDLSALQTKVNAEQAKVKAAILAKAPKTYPSANSAILAYANLCSYTGMRSIIASSLQQSTPGASDGSAVLRYVKSFMAAAATVTTDSGGNVTGLDNTAEMADEVGQTMNVSPDLIGNGG